MLRKKPLNSHVFLSPDDTPIKQTDPLPEFSAREEYKEAKLWKGVEIGGKTMKIDLKVIEPYKKVLSHGGQFNVL